MAVATQQDVETSLMRELTPEEEKYVLDLLDRVERLIQTRIPDLQARMDASPCDGYQNLVADVEAEAVARVFRAPDAGIYNSETEGNYSYSINYRVASGLLDILDSEWSKLGATAWGVINPQTDGYLYSRGIYGSVFDYRNYNPQYPPNATPFQYGWPAQDSIAESFDSNYPGSGWIPLGRVWYGP